MPNNQPIQVGTKISLVIQEKIAVAIMMIGAVSMMGAIIFAVTSLDTENIGKEPLDQTLWDCIEESWACMDGGQYLPHQCSWMAKDCFRNAGFSVD